MGLQLNTFEYPDLQTAWEKINEYLVNNEYKITSGNGNIYGTEMASYDNVIYAESCKIDRNFNFGKVLGYTDKKWTKLIKNYVNYDYLDLVASEIQKREKTKNPHYNYTFHFDNKYGSGKDCLIALNFSRRRKDEPPTITFSTRASEVTKRLIFDFLLIQRIAEYVYGKDQNCRVICHIAFMFINVECFLMYCAWKGLKNVVKKQKVGPMNRQMEPHYSKYQQRVLDRYQFFLDTPLEKITFKVHTRAAAQVKRHPETGGPLANCKDCFAKNLKLFQAVRIRQNDVNKLNSTL